MNKQLKHPTKSNCRLYVIKAKEAPIAAIFRKGPSRQVQILKWDMVADTFTPGQWFKGRIYERKCDVSPDGKYLIYFAAKWKPPMYSWTAISKLPYLTALALWNKGPSNGGGGLFDGERTVWLDHLFFDLSETKTGPLPADWYFGNKSRFEERFQDDQVFRERMKRDGWIVKQEGEDTLYGSSREEYLEKMHLLTQALEQMRDGNFDIDLPYVQKPKSPYPDAGPMSRVYDPAEILQKIHGERVLEMTTLGFLEKNGPTHVIKYRVLDSTNQCEIDLGRADWADWSESGDLLFAKDGCIYRLPKADTELVNAIRLIDLNGSRFEAVEAPEEYKTW